MSSSILPDPTRPKAYRMYWAALSDWSKTLGISKELIHEKLKEEIGFKHLYELKVSKILDISYEITTIVAGGPGK